MNDIATTSYSFRKLVAFHLAPGVATFLIYLLLAGPLGITVLLALPIAILVGEVPVAWAIVFRQVRKETDGAFTWRAALPWASKVPWWIYIAIGIPLILFSVLMIGGVGPAIDQRLLATVFSWVPDWFVLQPPPELFPTLSRELILTVWVLSLVVFAGVGGFTQELYFRGFLLPRMTHLGAVAPLLNAVLFAMFHFIAPWGWPVFLIISLPWAYLVWWRRSVKIGLFIHIGMLLTQWLLMTLIVFGVIEFPA